MRHTNNYASNLEGGVSRGFIRRRQPAKIAAYFVRIFLLPLPTLSVFSLKLLKKIISLPPTLVSSDGYFETS